MAINPNIKPKPRDEERAALLASAAKTAQKMANQQPSSAAEERDRLAQEEAAARDTQMMSGDFAQATSGAPILYNSGQAGTNTDLERFRDGKGYAVYDSFTDADGNQYVAVSGKNSSFIEKINADGTTERVESVSRKKGKRNTNLNRVFGVFDSLKNS